MAKKKKPVKPKKITKKKIASMARTQKRKAWKDVAEQVKLRDGNVCVICKQPHDKLNVHHLLPREIKTYWLEPMNLISLCPRHHKFSFVESFHRNPLWACLWLQKNRPEQWEWVLKVLTSDPPVTGT